MSFEIIGEIENVQTIAIGKAIRDIKRIESNSVRDDGESLKELQLSNYLMVR